MAMRTARTRRILSTPRKGGVISSKIAPEVLAEAEKKREVEEWLREVEALEKREGGEA